MFHRNITKVTSTTYDSWHHLAAGPWICKRFTSAETSVRNWNLLEPAALGASKVHILQDVHVKK